MDFKYSYFTAGSSQQLRELIDCLDYSFEPVFKENNIKDDSLPFKVLPQMAIETRARMDASFVLGATVGVCFFIASWAGNKVLDECYDTYIKPGFKSLTHKLRLSEKFANEEKLDFYAVANFNDLDCAVVVRLTSDLVMESEAQNLLIKETLKSASSYIKQYGAKGKVHYYHINSGKVNVEPMLRSSIKEIQAER
ncbi:hypothetical protein [Vibrio parahaemolyticus]|uniref:hypothetical protein n=1 Tax=Vibrio parahaemolyticus TaxID=670 RepID=UPI0011200743|nr:hypothetical protein [Vibrio parahaemolyticus]TOL35063.1 hypothetical protein CGI01_07940 [Vibrio parahaemolyticus]